MPPSDGSDDARAIRTRRLERCERCRQTRPTCICDRLAPIACATPLVVLVHRLETWKTSNTGRLAALTLGARFEPWGVKGAATPTLPDGPLLLLFPSDDARLLTPADATTGATLVVPDGNWPQARKIARRVMQLAPGRVTPVRVQSEAPSGYSLRHTERIDALSTIESIAYALRVLEGNRGPEVAASVLALFDAFVARHEAFSRAES